MSFLFHSTITFLLLIISPLCLFNVHNVVHSFALSSVPVPFTNNNQHRRGCRGCRGCRAIVVSSSIQQDIDNTNNDQDDGKDDDNKNDIEPYVGPIGSIYDMEGGIAIAESALHVLVGPSLVANGRGLFLAIYNDIDDMDDMDDDGNDDGNDDNDDMVEEVIIPQGTPLCGYSKGYFTSQEEGDKSVAFLYTSDTLVFYNKQLMGISDAINMANLQHIGNCDEILWGHDVIMTIDDDNDNDNCDKKMCIKTIAPNPKIQSRIFIPDAKENNNSEFAPTCLGMYSNDLAYDPNETCKENYIKTSNENNILQLIWRLDLDTTKNILVPTWPVVVAKQDFRLCNTVPMEVGLQYGFQYWKSFSKEV